MALLTEEQQNVAVNALATTLGKQVSDIEAILTGDKPTEVDTLVSERIKKVRKEGEDGGKGKLQKIANAEAKKLFGMELGDADTIVDLLSSVKETYKPEIKPGDLTEEQVKTHPTYQTIERKLREKETELTNEVEKARNEGKAEVAKQQLKTEAIKALADYGAVLSDDPKIAAVQERMYLEQFDNITRKEIDNVVTFWQPDGEGNLKRIETDKLLPVASADFFKGKVEAIYTTKVSDQTSSTGLPPSSGSQGNGGGGLKHFKGTLPKTEAEKDAIMQDTQTHSREARQEVLNYWNEQSKK